MPLKAVALNLVSVGAACGLLVLIFQDGVGASLLGVQPAPLDGWVPLFLLAILFGLSMDYEVFLVARVTEAWDDGADNTTAVASGLARTGRLVTIAALIMGVSFAAFVVGRIPGLQQLGVGLRLAIVIDATLIRGLLAPALLVLFGRWNWWLPRLRHAQQGARRGRHGGRRRGGACMTPNLCISSVKTSSLTPKR